MLKSSRIVWLDMIEVRWAVPTLQDLFRLGAFPEGIYHPMLIPIIFIKQGNMAKVLFASTLLIIFLISACDRLEIKENYYPNHEHLKKAGEPGNWVPVFIPISAVEIREKHKIDTGAEVLTFYFANYSELSLSNFCDKAIVNEVELPSSRFLDVPWWPDSLYSGRNNKENLENYDFYICERQSYFAVKKIDHDRYQAFYWK